MVVLAFRQFLNGGKKCLGPIHWRLSKKICIGIVASTTTRVQCITSDNKNGMIPTIWPVLRKYLCTSPHHDHNNTNRSNGADVAQRITVPPTSWIDLYAPSALRPYLKLARVDKAVGTWLLFWPCCWGAAIAAPAGQLPDMLLIAKFAAGAFIMRGAGCTINDIWDRDFDKHVERTKTRPLASGEITIPQALAFLGLQLSAGLGILVSFNWETIAWGLGSMPLVVAYPLMKRFTNYPQFVLGLAFNWGAIVGWTAVHGSANIEQILPLYAAGVCWTLVYDTIYGYQDVKDDTKLGLKSTAIHFGETPQWTLTTLAAGTISGLVATGLLNDLNWPFYAGVGGAGTHLLWQIWTADIKDPRNLWNRFESNKYFGAAISLAIIAGHF